jgi:lipopolysaccharide biosynthesis regulator YciM
LTPVTKIVKKKKRIKLNSILNDILTSRPDEEILEKYQLTKLQLSKVYSRLYQLGLLSEEDLERRIELRGASDISHIPLAQLPPTMDHFTCESCGYLSRRHFTQCPECSAINLRKISASKGYGLVRSMGQFNAIMDAYASTGA